MKIINKSDEEIFLPWESRKIFWVDGVGHGSVGILETTIFFCSALFFCSLQDNEVHITYEDQQQINKFARFNARLHDLKDELESKKVRLFAEKNFSLMIKT